ncbi:hypothetical protein [Thermoflavimicrobium daqui]|uniref:VWFA domain-containing protein n=1 Tax=Thermoflavimicrobium daqui TaxID=2137476 RepID=A0A364K5J7_9BACL|nr:hypothetical protein [Thermoflavimicrobium daqui]RAL25574.1 hypothetical protein DL897_05700 [Thermoflavimicrobium daqui]
MKKSRCLGEKSVERQVIMKYKFRVTLLAFTVGVFPLLSGCSTVIEKIQQTTGNNVEKVETKLNGQEHKKPVKTGVEKNLLPPAPATDLANILKDDGKGRYAGNLFNHVKVSEALDQMPKGMSEEQIYAYLLGLVGENYKGDNTFFKQMEPNYRSQLDGLKSRINKSSSKDKATNVLVMLNASNSMQADMDGKSKLTASKLALTQFAASLPKNTQLSVSVFGQGNMNSLANTSNCQEPKTIYPKQSFDAKKFSSAWNQVTTFSRQSPLTQAIRSIYGETREGASNTDQTVLLITDQSDSCGGNLTHEAEEVRLSNEIGNFHIIGLKVNRQDEAELRKVANTAGGSYQRAADSTDLRRVFYNFQKEISKKNEPWQLQGLQKITQSYRTDSLLLSTHYESVLGKLKKENERLNKANEYIKDLQKINIKEWEKVDQWIQNRYQQVEDYMDNQNKTASGKLEKDYETNLEQLEQDWEKDGKSKEEFEKHKQEVLKEQPPIKNSDGDDSQTEPTEDPTENDTAQETQSE